MGNSIMYVLFIGVAYCFLSEKLMRLQAWRRKKNRIELRHKRAEARGKSGRPPPELEVTCLADVQISEEKIRNLVELVKEVNRAPEVPTLEEQTSGLRARSQQTARDEESVA